MPILIVASGIVVRYAYALASHKPLSTADIVGVAVKSLPWAFFVSSLRFSCISLLNNKELVTKIYFPKEIFPLASVIASLFDLMVASCALVIFLFVVRVGVAPSLVWVPLLLVGMILLAAGIGMIISAAGLFFRDVKFIVEVFLTFGIFFTPVFYDASIFGKNAKWILLNPVSPILDGFSATIAHHRSPEIGWLAYSFILAVVLLICGYGFFKHLEPAFAESI